MLAMMLTGEKGILNRQLQHVQLSGVAFYWVYLQGLQIIWRALEPFLKSACLYIFLRNSWNKTLFFMDGYVGKGDIG